MFTIFTMLERKGEKNEIQKLVMKKKLPHDPHI